MRANYITLYVIFFLTCCLITKKVNADSFVVDKVYHPYVLPFEREFEWRLVSVENDSIPSGYNALGQRFAYGQSITDNMMVEGYLVAERDNEGSYHLSAYEAEMRWMLTEQGQYWADWGALFEVQKKHNLSAWELTSGILFEKEIGRTSLTLNAFMIYEWGETLQNEIETEFRLKYRYRLYEQFQPAIELYSGQDYTGLGPAFMGMQRFSNQRQLKWEAAVIKGVGPHSKDEIVRISIEYEF